MVKRVTFSAILMALSVICLYSASALSTGRIAALALASLFGGVCISEYGVRYGMALYIGTSVLSLLLIPNRMFTLLYVLLVGYYPVVKLYIERLNKLWLEWLLKILFFNVVLVVIYVLFKLFFMPVFTSALAMLTLQYLGLVILASEIVFVIYDLAFSYMIGYFRQFLRRISHE